MAYNPLIPDANELLSQSQPEIQGNFAEIQSFLGVNHIGFGAPINAGKHLFLQLPEHAAPTTAINEAGFYANVGTTSGVTELFFRRENDGASIPMTEMKAVTATNGWTFLPSGIILQWGTLLLVGANAPGTPVVFPRTFPTACYNVQVTMTQSVGGQSRVAYVVAGSLTTSQFLGAVKNSQTDNRNDGNVYWFAIGV